LAKAIEEVLGEVTHPDVRARAAIFSIENMTDEYLKLAAPEFRRAAIAVSG
jgi:hypothetical protein